MAGNIPDHYDMFGRLVKLGDTVVYPNSNSLQLGIVEKLNPKMLRLTKVSKTATGTRFRKSTTLVYSNEVCIVDGPDITMFLLKRS